MYNYTYMYMYMYILNADLEETGWCGELSRPHQLPQLCAHDGVVAEVSTQLQTGG